MSKELQLKDNLAHRDNVRELTEPILVEMYAGKRNYKVEILNVRKYLSHYPNDNEKNRHGYTYIGAELKDLRYNGVGFFLPPKELYQLPDGSLTLKKRPDAQRASLNALVVGIVPYSWIEYVDTKGDEFSYRVQFFIRFKGKEKMPFKDYVYYSENKNYREGDPHDLKYQRDPKRFCVNKSE